MKWLVLTLKLIVAVPLILLLIPYYVIVRPHTLIDPFRRGTR
jgi:hypothetical protein